MATTIIQTSNNSQVTVGNNSPINKGIINKRIIKAEVALLRESLAEHCKFFSTARNILTSHHEGISGMICLLHNNVEANRVAAVQAALEEYKPMLEYLSNYREQSIETITNNKLSKHKEYRDIPNEPTPVEFFHSQF